MAEPVTSSAGASSLLDSTRRRAGEVAAVSAEARRRRILELLGQREQCLFELAEQMDVFDHVISGRVTELLAAGKIERTGQRRIKPSTGCPCDIYRLRVGAPAAPPQHLHGYPLTLTIPPEGVFERGEPLGEQDLPGVPYARSAAQGGVRLNYRVLLVQCEGCGNPLHLALEKKGGQEVKRWQCATPGCNRTYELAVVSEPGRSGVLALVMKHL